MQILQLNLNGLNSKGHLLTNTLTKHRIDIALLNEIKISNHQEISSIDQITGFYWILDDARNGILVNEKHRNLTRVIRLSRNNSRYPLSSIAIEIRHGNAKILIISVYRSPAQNYENLIEFFSEIEQVTTKYKHFVI